MVATRQEQTEKEPILTLGRYALHGEIASGGMATVHFGRMSSLGGFSRTVAIKRMRRDIAMDPEFVAMFLDEARLTSRVEHPNVVATLDVVAEGGEVFLVMEYVKGESLSRLIRAGRHSKDRIPINIAVSIICGALTGLHAAHDALGEGGAPLGIIHRDVSPQNILVGEDGVTRITDFGIAKAESRLQITRDGMMKGKLCYMAPEQLSRAGRLLDRRVDIFACAVVAWELISGKKLFQADHPGETMANVLNAPVPPLTGIRDDVTVAVDRAIRKALARNPDQRWKTAEEFALALEEATPNLGSNRVVGAWVQKMAGEVLANRHKYVREIESMGAVGGTPVSQIHPTPIDASGEPQRAESDYPSDIPAQTLPAAGAPPPGAAAIAPPRVPRFDKQQINAPQSASPTQSAPTSSPRMDPPPLSPYVPQQRQSGADFPHHDEQPSVPSIGSAPIPGPRPAPLQQPLSPRPTPLATAQQPVPQPAQQPVPQPAQQPVPQPAQQFSPRPEMLAPSQQFVPRPPAGVSEPAPIPSPVPQPPAELIAPASSPLSAQTPMPFAAPNMQVQPIAPYAFDPSAPLPAQPAADVRPVAYSAPAWTPPTQADGSVDGSLGSQGAAQLDSLSAGEALGQQPMLESRLFGSPRRTAAVYVGAILLLGLSLGLAIIAFSSGSSKDTTTQPGASATATPSSEPAASATATATATAVATATATEAPVPTSTDTPATNADTAPANATPSAKGPSKTKSNPVPVPTGPAKTPAKGTQSYIPDRP